MYISGYALSEMEGVTEDRSESKTFNFIPYIALILELCKCIAYSKFLNACVCVCTHRHLEKLNNLHKLTQEISHRVGNESLIYLTLKSKFLTTLLSCLPSWTQTHSLVQDCKVTPCHAKRMPPREHIPDCHVSARFLLSFTLTITDSFDNVLFLLV